MEKRTSCLLQTRRTVTEEEFQEFMRWKESKERIGGKQNDRYRNVASTGYTDRAEERSDCRNYYPEREERPGRRTCSPEKEERLDRRNYYSGRQERSDCRNYYSEKEERLYRRYCFLEENRVTTSGIHHGICSIPKTQSGERNDRQFNWRSRVPKQLHFSGDDATRDG
ncbi:hypothetical protein PoB_004394500 [Plakobranchus ocellatus]|uniref:Uncharacterized protein n=1 Tax=Plakobranchus ocellatus TaxID=259542 RepID=A0AAV4BA02_9GAST|nr:hypothetical protein PoB_004394500 [Plakobranchus ocellatus]